VIGNSHFAGEIPLAFAFDPSGKCILLKQKDKQNSSNIKNFAIKLAKQLPYDLEEIETSLIELIDEKVLILEEDLLYQKRMRKDGNISDKRAKAGSKGAKKKSVNSFANDFAIANDEANSEAKHLANSEIEIENENKIDNKKEKKEFYVTPLMNCNLTFNKKINNTYKEILLEHTSYKFPNTKCTLVKRDYFHPLEEKYELTRNILMQLVHSDCYLSISTKSKLILRDLDLLKQIKNLTVCMSINTLDENFRKDMDSASTIKERLSTLKELHDNGIYTILFMSPIFPYITKWKEIIEESKNYIDEYWFENLNLRGQYKSYIMNYIKEKYSKYYDTYVDIYIKNNKKYWYNLANEINAYCDNNNINYKNYFYHEELVKNKKENK